MLRKDSFRIAVFSFLLTGAFTLFSTAADAQVKPFKIRGVGISSPLQLPDGPGPAPPSPHGIVGNATHLGRHVGMGHVQIATANFDEDFNITGKFGSGPTFTFIAANGDKLVCEYGRDEMGSYLGDYEATILGLTEENDPIYETYFIADFVPVSDQCTGKFEGVTGSWTMEAWTEPFVPGQPFEYAWEGEGKLTFQKKKKKK